MLLLIDLEILTLVELELRPTIGIDQTIQTYDEVVAILILLTDQGHDEIVKDHALMDIMFRLL